MLECRLILMQKHCLRTSGGDVDCNLVMNNVTKLSGTKIDPELLIKEASL